MPLVFNATVVNGMAVTGRFEGDVQYVADDEVGGMLALTFQHSDLLWPWSGKRMCP